MSEPTSPDKPQDGDDATRKEKRKKIGFGAHSESYRARWAENHPGMNRTFPAANEPASPPVETEIVPEPKVDEGGSRLATPADLE